MSNFSSEQANLASFDSKAIHDHVKLLHERAVGVAGKFVVSAFNEGAPGTITHHKVGDIEGMCVSIMAHATTPGANVYTGPHLMRSDLPRGQRGKEGDIVAVLGLVADMDADTGKIGDLPVTASYIVETSPGNTQAITLFHQPMTPASAKRLARALQKATGADFGTSDIAHVWRIAGTLNWPNAAKLARGRSPEPFEVRFEQPFEGVVYSEADLTAALAPYLSEASDDDHNERFSGSVDSAPLRERLTDTSRALLTADGQPDRSAHAARVVERLHFEGFSLNEVVSLCLERPGAWTDRYKNHERLTKDLESCWNKFVAPKDAESEANAEAARKFADHNRTGTDDDGLPSRVVRATPFVFRDPKEIPKRATLYAGHLSRKFLSATFGVGGGGKSTLVIADALAMVSGVPVVGHYPVRPLKVWYINLEDPSDEIERRFAAAAIHYEINPKFLNANLFVDSGRDQEFVVLRNEGRGTRVVEPVVLAIIQEMLDNGIDVLIIDPFISTHEVEENDNSKIQQVAAQFVRVANDANVAIELVHHVNKAVGDGKGEVTADSGRGASALKDKARSIRVINGMSAEEAEKAGIDPRERFSYFRVSNGKSNLKKRSGESEWRELVSVNLGNGNWHNPGDSVGVATEWKWPAEDALADTLTPAQLDEIRARLREGQFRSHPQATEWAGHVFADVLKIDVTDKAGKSRVTSLMKALATKGHFQVINRRDGKKREAKPFFEVVEAPHPDSSGAGSTLH